MAAGLTQDGGPLWPAPPRPPASQDGPLLLHTLQPLHPRQDLGQFGSRLVPKQVPGQPAGQGPRSASGEQGGEGWADRLQGP